MLNHAQRPTPPAWPSPPPRPPLRERDRPAPYGVPVAQPPGSSAPAHSHRPPIARSSKSAPAFPTAPERASLASTADEDGDEDDGDGFQTPAAVSPRSSVASARSHQDPARALARAAQLTANAHAAVRTAENQPGAGAAHSEVRHVFLCEHSSGAFNLISVLFMADGQSETFPRPRQTSHFRGKRHSLPGTQPQSESERQRTASRADDIASTALE